MKECYEKIIDLPHHTSKTRERMSMENRAAQFSPFAALKGHDEALEETRKMSEKIINDGNNIDMIFLDCDI